MRVSSSRWRSAALLLGVLTFAFANGYSDSAAPPMDLSPDGTLIVTSSGNPGCAIDCDSAAFGTNIIQNGTLVTAISGWPAGWFDNDELLVNSYQLNNFGAVAYAGCAIYNSAGNNTGAACGLPNVLSFQQVSASTLYALNLNAIVSISAGTVSWMSADPVAPATWLFSDAVSSSPYSGDNFNYLDALAGSYVVFVTDSKVVAQAY